MDVDREALQEFKELYLEYRLTIAASECQECVNYISLRRHVLLPEVLKTAKKQKLDPVVLFANYVKDLHRARRH